jgi:endonuclease/exonuclease/phosphatase family metal-dependent hydrolase
MGRRLLLTHLESGGGGIEGGRGEGKGGDCWTIGNVHLESLDSAAMRAEQLRKAGVILSAEEERKKNVVLCGDFK